MTKKSIGDWLKKAWAVVVFPALKAAKPALRRWAKKKLIPTLQKKVDAGAIDAVVDARMEEIILGMIDKI